MKRNNNNHTFSAFGLIYASCIIKVTSKNSTYEKE